MDQHNASAKDTSTVLEAPILNLGTWSVPEAGQRIYGLSRRSSYQAAKRGDLPVVRVGRLDRVPIAAVAAMFMEIGRVTAAAISARQSRKSAA
jgi:hypothetical protein